MKKCSGTLIILDMALLVMIFGSVLLLFKLSSRFIIQQLFLQLLFLLIGFIGLVACYKNKSYGFNLLALVFGVGLINLLVVYFTRGGGLVKTGVLAIVAAFAFIVSLAKMSSCCVCSLDKEEGYQEKLEKVARERVESEAEPLGEVPEVEVYGGKGKKATKKSKAQFKPGKFIASKKGTKFHTAKCDWAKKIDKRNRVWLKKLRKKVIKLVIVLSNLFFFFP